MSEYASIKNLYKMDEADHKRGPEDGFSNDAFGGFTWLVTEKVDGMNMRVILDLEADPVFRIAGRSDKAQIPGDLMDFMLAQFKANEVAEVFANEDGSIPSPIVLYGEGYGPGIQKVGAAYGGVKRFILFDVKVGNTWLDWDDVVDVAGKLFIPHVPVLGRGLTLEEAKALVHDSELLGHGHEHVEGFVARSEPQLFDKWGQRLVFKYKVRDLRASAVVA